MSFKFKEADELKELPVGTHEPCQCVSVKRFEASEENRAKYPGMEASWCFRFVLHDEKSELNGHSAVKFCNETESKLGHLFQFVVDLNGGEEPKQFEPTDFVGKWYRCRVRTDGEKLRVQGADAIPAPNGEASDEDLDVPF